MSSLIQDLKYAFRTIGKAPAFAAVVVGTLTLGIGANTAIFSVVNGVVLRPLPYPAPERLVRITSELRTFDATDTGVAALELFDYQSRTDLFSGVAGLYPINANVTGGAQPERIEAMLATWNYFSILGAAPELGRVFGPGDDGPGIPQVAVVSDAYWRRRLGADPDVLGRTLTVDGDPFVLIGIMPPDFRHPGRTVQTDVDLWAPAGYRDLPFGRPSRTQRFLEGALARLQPGVTLAQARERLDAYGEAQRQAFPSEYPSTIGWNPLVVPLRDDVVGAVTTPMLILLGAVGFVLLIACVNVANLMLTRASERQAEMAVRASLGASAGRLARQVLSESAVLAAAGGALGLLLALWSLRALVTLAPSRLPRIGGVGLDGSTLLVALGLSTIATLLFGLAPAWQMRRIRCAGGHARGGPRRQRRTGGTTVAGCAGRRRSRHGDGAARGRRPPDAKLLGARERAGRLRCVESDDRARVAAAAERSRQRSVRHTRTTGRLCARCAGARPRAAGGRARGAVDADPDGRLQPANLLRDRRPRGAGG